MNCLKNGVPIKSEKERIVKYIKLFDYEQIENNEFIVTNQVVYQSINNSIRCDLILYVNGIPLVNIECKNPVEFSSSWYDAFVQIKRYENEIPELFKYIQIGVAVEAQVKYFPIVPWQEKEEVNIYEWKSKGKDSIEATVDMLSPEKLLDIIKNFIFYRVKEGTANKVITRYMQYRAANKIVDRVKGNLEGKEIKNKGLIWHWQGSGKTLTMIFSAYKLYTDKKLENPTVFFIVDRQDLEDQLNREFSALDITKPDSVSNINELREIVEHDSYRGKRGIILTLVHKFRPGGLEGITKELEKRSKTEETIQTRSNIIAFIDEGHRTQYGTLSSQMRYILKNAFFFAFTGTPISKKGRDSYRVFSYPPQELYLDKYFITDSIKDKFTKRISYQPRLKNEVHIKKENIDAFIKSELEEVPEEFREKIEVDIVKKLNASKVILQNPKNIATIAQDIKKHFLENVEGKFKAMIVAENRKACVLFKRELDKIFPAKYSEIVMTYNPNEKHKEVANYHQELKKRFPGLDDDSIKDEIINNFKEEEFPKIVIVTNMLLTGFDAPCLQTMYLYKLLKEHRLLQAIARTNRPYKNIKEAGLIVDYVGILNRFKEAFAAYSREEMTGALYDLEDLKRDFSSQLQRLMEIFEGVSKNTYDKQTLLKATEVLTEDSKTGKKFIEGYRDLRRIFELLGPDIIKANLFSDFKWVSAIYTYYSKRALATSPDIKTEKYFNRVLKYIYNSTEIKSIAREIPEITFDENYIEKLKEKTKNKKEQAANIVFAINKYILVEKDKDPVYIAVSDKIERILELWRQKKKDYESISQYGAEIFEEINKLKSRQKKLGLNDLGYSILLILEKKIGKKEELIKDAKDISQILKDEMYSGFMLQPTAVKKIEKEVRGFLRKKKKKYDLSYEEMNNTHNSIKETIEEYGKNI
jgi:type I restriction enzyme R subunit